MDPLPTQNIQGEEQVTPTKNAPRPFSRFPFGFPFFDQHQVAAGPGTVLRLCMPLSNVSIWRSYTAYWVPA